MEALGVEAEKYEQKDLNSHTHKHSHTNILLHDNNFIQFSLKPSVYLTLKVCSLFKVQTEGKDIFCVA